MKSKVEHKWDWCSMCGLIVRCGTCGNNSCNSGYGELKDGSVCPDCESAYEKQQKWVTDEDKIGLFDMILKKVEDLQDKYYELEQNELEKILNKTENSNEENKSTE